MPKKGVLKQFGLYENAWFPLQPLMRFSKIGVYLQLQSSVTINFRLLNLASKLSLDTCLLSQGHLSFCLTCIFTNINENNRNKRRKKLEILFMKHCAPNHLLVDKDGALF